ncbi:MAG: hypothetical protein A2V63_08280 [Candidatus Eisenbacteria bacterium RBG_19FT_COMBO_70_11]|nr:MAG: hypothetical protein A2V63_08280 [Candidatus Eisenbacteria bacterium RBG_19FT_COMBO_70_11]
MTKQFLLGILALVLIAAPARALQVGQAPAASAAPSDADDNTAAADRTADAVVPIGTIPDRPPIEGRSPAPRPVSETARPVPEPGTLALASMGLLALGAAARRHRGR